jgi:hypothetical protein
MSKKLIRFCDVIRQMATIPGKGRRTEEWLR